MNKLQYPVVAVSLAFGFFLGAPIAQAAPVPPAQLTDALHWRSVGPYKGGRVTTVTGVPSEPNLFYMGTASGGVWESDDYGDSWKNITDKYFGPQTSGTVGYMAVAPSNPKIIYVGTGDSAPRNTVTPGHGMYKSTDAGKTWKYVGLGDTRMIGWVLVDPKNPDVVYVAALGHLFGPNPQRGVFKTTDGGQTWKKVLFVNDGTGAITMAMDPDNPQVVYATMWQMSRSPWDFSSGGPGSGIYKTTDGGAHWSNITHNQGLPKGIFGKAGIAVAPSNPNVVYALVQAKTSDAGKPGGLYRSENGGQSWALMNNSLDITQRAFYYMRVYVDPKDPNTIYLPNVSIYVSHNGGKTIQRLRVNGGDNHAIWINPDNTRIMIEGNDGGATVTINGGKTWSTEDNQPTGQFYHANLDQQFPFWIYGAQQDSGTSVGPSAVRRGKIPALWTSVQAGEESWVVPEPDKPWVTFGQSYYGRFYRDNRQSGEVRAVSPWPAYKFGSADFKIKYRYDWIHGPIVFAPGNPNELLVGANVVFESNDQGLHWKAISPDLTRNDKSKQQRPGGPISADVTSEESYDAITALAVSPVQPSVIWSGSDDGLVYVTTNGGSHWSEVRPPELPKWSEITCIEPSHTQAGTAFVTASRYRWDDYRPYVYETTDYGKHWTEITAGLPDDEYVESVRQDPNDPGLMFLGTSATAYMSLDGGHDWKPLKLNLPAVKVEDIAIQPAQHAVVLATFGRAYWVLDNLQFLEQLSDAHVASNAPYLFKPQQTWLVKRSSFSFGGGSAGGTNAPVGAAVFFYLPSSYTAGTPVKLSFQSSDGKTINSFTLPEKSKQSESPFGGAMASKPAELHAGMNHFQWNLRYPDGVEINGIFHSGFGAAVPVGPEIVPGTYSVALTYDGTTLTEPFTVKLDPRVSTTQAELQQRFDLLTQIDGAISSLDTAINAATAARRRLQKAVAAKSVSAERADKAVAALDHDIDSVVNFKIQSGEGGLVFRPVLRSWLGSLFTRIDMAYVAPTESQQQVAAMYIGEAHVAVTRMKSDVVNAEAVLK